MATVADLIASAREALKDPDGVRWPDAFLQRALNETYLDVCRLDPRANTQVVTYECAEGTRQDVAEQFQDAFAVVDVVMNLDLRKRLIQRVDRMMIDQNLVGWHGQRQAKAAELWAADPAIPTSFHLYPPAKADHPIELVLANTPVPHAVSSASLTDAIRLRDIYLPPLIDGVLYRAFRIDLEDQSSAARSVGHYQVMVSALTPGQAK
jgi:hypothetical protein